jgi:hypothetical protein
MHFWISKVVMGLIQVQTEVYPTHYPAWYFDSALIWILTDMTHMSPRIMWAVTKTMTKKTFCHYWWFNPQDSCWKHFWRDINTYNYITMWNVFFLNITTWNVLVWCTLFRNFASCFIFSRNVMHGRPRFCWNIAPIQLKNVNLIFF